MGWFSVLVTTEVSNRQNNFASSALESKRPHFHAPLLTSLCKSALALVESTGLPRLKAIRVESFIFSFSCTLPIPGLANRLWLRSNRHSYYGIESIRVQSFAFSCPTITLLPNFLSRCLCLRSNQYRYLKSSRFDRC